MATARAIFVDSVYSMAPRVGLMHIYAVNPIKWYVEVPQVILGKNIWRVAVRAVAAAFDRDIQNGRSFSTWT